MEIVDIAIIGGGPAGTAAGIYAARKQLNTVCIVEEFGGQSIVSPAIENWIGTKSISGSDLAKSFQEHLRAYESARFVIQKQKATAIVDNGDTLTITLKDGSQVTAKGIFLATGSTRRKLNVPGADTFEHKGLTYCASCDGPLFADKDVAVIGGGNAGFETAAQLLAYAKSVTLLHRHTAFKADAITVEKVCAHPRMKALGNVDTKEILGKTLLSGLTYVNKESGKEETISVQGVFVEIGLIPETSLLKDLVTLDGIQRVVVDPKTQQSSHARIWAAGDCTDGIFHQNNIAAGDAVKALEHAYLQLHGGA